MRRVKNKESWTFVDPYEVKEVLGFDLADLWGSEFEKAYATVEAALDKEIFLYKTVNARALFKSILQAQVETGLPYIAFKDTINRANPNKHYGIIPGVNLCTESFSIVKSNEFAHSCNLVSINLAEASDLELPVLCQIAVRLLDNTIDQTSAPMEEATRHNSLFRTIGVGVMGLADKLASLHLNYVTGLPYIDKLFEDISYYTTNASALLSQERGAFAAFEGSEWSKGLLINSQPVSWFEEHSYSPQRWKALAEFIGEHGIRNSHLCVTGETKILTRGGQIAIKNLVGKQVDVWNGEEWSEVTPFETGVSKLLRVKFSNGLALDCTPEHRFLVATPKRDTKELGGLKTIEVEAKDLRIGDCLPKFFVEPTGDGKDLLFAYESGLFCGDGSISCSKAGKYPRKELRLYGAKQSLADHIRWKSTTTWGDPDMVRGYLPDEVLDKYLVPHEYSVLSKQEWLAGLVDTDGYSGSTGVSITMAKKDFAIEVALLVQSLGGEPHIIEATRHGGYSSANPIYYIVTISLHSVNTVFSLFQPKRVKINLGENKSKVGKRHLVEVTTVEYLSEEEMTYCFTEPKKGTGIFNGVLTKQCAIAPNTSSSWVNGCTASVLPTFSRFFFDRAGKGVVPIMPPNIKKDFWFYPENKHLDQKKVVKAISTIQKWIDTGISMELLFNQNIDAYDGRTIRAIDIYETMIQAWEEGCKAIYYVRAVQKDDFKEEESCTTCAN